MCRLLRILVIVALALSAGATPAGATPAKKLDAQLGALWTAVLQTPSAQNSFGTGGEAFGCWRLDGTVAPDRGVVVHGEGRHPDLGRSELV